VGGALAVVAVLVAAWSLTAGDVDVPVVEVVSAITGGADPQAQFVVGTLRLPRVIVGLGVGAAFGMSGAIFQSLVRNPLASPDIVGFTAGASLGAVVMIVVAGADPRLVSVGAVAGGLMSAALVFGLSWRRGVQAHRLVLVGIGVGFTVAAAVDYLLTRAEINEVQQAAVWLTGSLNGRTWDEVTIVLVALVLLGPIAVLLQRSLDRLDLGDDTAVALGVRTAQAKLALVAVAVALAALGVAAAGPVAFVAFVSGPIARRLIGTSRACVVASALVGAVVTVTADLAARRLLAPVELPVGVMTAVIGAPYLLWLLRRQVRTGVL
jgi:iron complex transport system permease protein